MPPVNGSTALLMIDIQNDYWKPPRLPRERFVHTAADLLDFSRSSGLLVVHVQHASRKPESKRFQPGTSGFDIHSAVAPLPDEQRVVKHTPGSFFGTNLDEVLRAAQVNRLIISGMQTQKCCDTTTREASARGYRCWFVIDAVETFDLKDHRGQPIARDDVARATFATLSNGFATVLSFAELRASL